VPVAEPDPEALSASGSVPSPASNSGPPALNAAFLVIALGRMIRDDVDGHLREHALSMRHLSALGHLSGQPGLSYSELARRAGITPQSMQATLQQLEGLHAVERRTVAGRGRTARLHVTDTGTELLRQGQRVIEAAEEQLIADLPAEQRPAFTAMLATVFTSALRRRSGSDAADREPG
jgi:DNA-binding MarR family transcriptional regulator